MKTLPVKINAKKLNYAKHLTVSHPKVSEPLPLCKLERLAFSIFLDIVTSKPTRNGPTKSWSVKGRK
ncbi:hypothetical protein Elgi_64210 [Paenibacillus elgii]|nr:hypothetical protein Elgi_64210 [Paenibacillus elgii]